MILIACGANLPSRYGQPVETLHKAYEAIQLANIIITAKSSIWKSAPVPYDENQLWYYNSVIAIETEFEPEELLSQLHRIEEDFGRKRSVLNAPRSLDLDIAAYHDRIINQENLIIPHERMHERLFVLKPLTEIAPDWIHPVSKKSVSELMADCDPSQEIELANTK